MAALSGFPLCRDRGTPKLYRTIEDTLREDSIPISMWDVAATNTKHELVHGWRRRQRGRADGAVRIADGSILGKDFDEGYVYVMEGAEQDASS